MFSHDWVNIICQSPIRDFADYVPVANKSYQIQKKTINSKKCVGIIDFSDLKKPRKTNIQIWRRKFTGYGIVLTEKFNFFEALYFGLPHCNLL